MFVLVRKLYCSLCTLRVCILCSPPIKLSVLRSINPQMHAEKRMSPTALRQALKNATTMNSNFAMRNSAKMRTTKTKYAADFPAALCTISILFFRSTNVNHNLHFELLIRILTHLFARMNLSVELLCLRHKLIESLTFSFC